MGRGTGHRGITITPEGSIQIAFSLNGVQCRERLRLKPTTANIKYAARQRAAILSEIERGVFDYRAHFPDSPRAAMRGRQRIPTVERLLEDYQTWAERSLAPSTAKGYASAIHHHLIPAFGEMLITDLSVSAIKAWLGGLNITAKRINNVLIPLRQITADAHTDGWIQSDPMKRIPAMKDRRQRPEPDPFTPDEVRALLAACRDETFRAFVGFAVATGMRTSELMAVRWDDVDWRAGTIRVCRALVEGRLSEVTKTSAGTRDVVLLPMALEALETMRPVTQMAQPEIFVYPRRMRPWEGYDEIRKTWTPMIRRAGVRYRAQYQTRHTYASWLLSAGEHPMWVAAQLGHADWGMIRKHYGRWIEDAGRQVGSNAASVFTGFSQGLAETRTGRG